MTGGGDQPKRSRRRRDRLGSRRSPEVPERCRPVLRDLNCRRRIERAEFVGITDRYAAHHTVVIDGVLTEPPQGG